MALEIAKNRAFLPDVLHRESERAKLVFYPNEPFIVTANPAALRAIN